MREVKIDRLHTYASAISSTDKDTIYFPIDDTSIVVNGKVYGVGAALPLELSINGASVTANTYSVGREFVLCRRKKRKGGKNYMSYVCWFNDQDYENEVVTAKIGSNKELTIYNLPIMQYLASRYIKTKDGVPVVATQKGLQKWSGSQTFYLAVRKSGNLQPTLEPVAKIRLVMNQGVVGFGL